MPYPNEHYPMRVPQAAGWLDMSRALPSEPVIVVHVLDDNGRAICCDLPWRPVPDEAYPRIPRMLCGCCQHVGMALALIS